MKVVLLTVHVVAAILLVGPITVAASVFPRYARLSLTRSGGVGGTDPVPAESARATALAMHRISRGYAVPALAVPVFGIGTGAAMHVLGDAWVLSSLVLTVAAAAVLAAALLPAQRAVLLDLPRAGGPVADGGRTLLGRLHRLSMVTGVFSLLWVAVVVLMILRPGSTTGV
ncbi:hypothetical protein [uncultured Friedmanniella sp.]|uniref:hypothetical protein n=1 Tax=uncultured Friedmanniella sp. TaxID=335381 RepID=UPI0035CB6A8B